MQVVKVSSSSRPTPTGKYTLPGLLSTMTTNNDQPKEGDLLRAYSKELYNYTLGKLEEVSSKSGDGKKSAAVAVAASATNGQPYILKRTQSDVGLKRKEGGTATA